MLNPDFCGKENFITVNTRSFNRRADLLFIEVTLRGIDKAVADRQRVRHTPFALIPSNLINAVTDLRHFHAV